MLFLGRPTYCIKARRGQIMKKKVGNVNLKKFFNCQRDLGGKVLLFRH